MALGKYFDFFLNKNVNNTKGTITKKKSVTMYNVVDNEMELLLLPHKSNKC